MFLGEPLAFTLGLDPGAIDQKMQGARALAIRDGNIQTFLTATECAEVGHGPIQPCKLQKARDQSGRLPERQAEQRLQSQARLDRRVSEGGRTATLTTRFSQTVSGSNQISNEPRCLRAALAIGLEPMALQWLDSCASWWCGR